MLWNDEPLSKWKSLIPSKLKQNIHLCLRVQSIRNQSEHSYLFESPKYWITNQSSFSILHNESKHHYNYDEIYIPISSWLSTIESTGLITKLNSRKLCESPHSMIFIILLNIVQNRWIQTNTFTHPYTPKKYMSKLPNYKVRIIVK